MLEAGETLFLQGERFTAMQVLVSGSVKLREASQDGQQRVVALRMPGDILGIEAWASGTHPYSAETITAVQLCQLHLPEQGRGSGRGVLLERLLRKTAIQLKRSTDLWQDLPALEKVSAFLQHFNAHAGPLPRRHLTRAEIGSLLGLAPETVVRALARLRPCAQA